MLNYLIGLKSYLESSAIPAGDSALVDATAVSAAIYRKYDRPALEWWMERHAGDSEVPGPLVTAFDQWSQMEPEKLDQWLAEQPPSAQLDALKAAMIPSLVDHNAMDKAAQNVAAIADPALQAQAADTLARLWSNRNPGAAARWRATLPPSQ